MLRVEELNAFYGLSHIIQGVGFRVHKGQIVCLLGRNGTGKSTTLKSIMGIRPPTKTGVIEYRDKDITGMAPEHVSRLGIAYVPEDRRIFPELTVHENLRLASFYSRQKTGAWTFDKIYALFPVLEKRNANLGSQLSGGEQQMLAIARALIANPELILMDEPSEGLAPLLVQLVAETISEIKRDKISILLVEQNYEMSENLGDYFYILSKGKIVYEGNREQITRDNKLIRNYLSV
ncbi:MAG: ABC transporter ATP-binding protein [Deltaproteobacteria bacterium]|nr:MAG: ABC transporter ATP-binding protein [Deltaproteobacteria bacterium]